MADELYSDLCSAVDADSKTARGEAQAGAVPWLVTFLASWAIKKLRKLGCERKDEIIAAVMRYVDSFVSNQTVRQMILVALDTASEALCPVSLPTETR